MCPSDCNTFTEADIVYVGDAMPDGTIYAGDSPDTCRCLFTTAADAPGTYLAGQALKYAAALDAHGRRDWQVPTIGELNVMFTHRAAVGGFDGSGAWPKGWYRSSSQSAYLRPIEKRFSDGAESDRVSRGGPASLRCVRG